MLKKLVAIGVPLFLINSAVFLLANYALETSVAVAWLLIALGSAVVAMIAYTFWTRYNSANMAKTQTLVGALSVHCDVIEAELELLEPRRKRADSESLSDDLRLAQEKLYRDVEFGLVSTPPPENTAREQQHMLAPDEGQVHDQALVLQTIVELTHQLRLLAINAKNEAVLAGSSGRGFAAVADKVVLLSKMTESAVGMLNQQIKIAGNPSASQGNKQLKGQDDGGYFSGIVEGIKDLDETSLHLMGIDLSHADSNKEALSGDGLSETPSRNQSPPESGAAADEILMAQRIAVCTERLALIRQALQTCQDSLRV